MMGYWGYPPYVSVAEKKAKAAGKLNQLRKKNPGIQPVRIEGRRAIARSWWGHSWNQNLERYADYSNRIGRGRSYVRHGAVLDLRVSAGKVTSLVQGSRSKPYSVAVNIKALDRKTWQEIKAACGGKLDSLQELLAGRFPKALGEIFMAQGKGLFPTPKEIEFSCSCPDWAYMCKHVAATLYGIGARLDEDPSLFFTLRNIEMRDLVAGAVEEKTEELLKKAKKKTGRVIEDADLADVFGIEMEEPAGIYRAGPERVGRSFGAKKPLKRAPKAKGRALPNKTSTPKQPESPFETVVRLVGKAKGGITVAGIGEVTGLDEKRIRYFVYKARKEGRIKNLRRGVYAAAG